MLRCAGGQLHGSAFFQGVRVVRVFTSSAFSRRPCFPVVPLSVMSPLPVPLLRCSPRALPWYGTPAAATTVLAARNRSGKKSAPLRPGNGGAGWFLSRATEREQRPGASHVLFTCTPDFAARGVNSGPSPVCNFCAPAVARGSRASGHGPLSFLLCLCLVFFLIRTRDVFVSARTGNSLPHTGREAPRPQNNARRAGRPVFSCVALRRGREPQQAKKNFSVFKGGPIWAS